MLGAKGVSLAYEDRLVVDGLDVEIPEGEVVSLIGPNGSGKSTILKALSRALKTRKGVVLLDGKDIQAISPRQVAKRLAILPQTPESPGDITVQELVWHGRYPHMQWWERAGAKDKETVDWALKETKLSQLAERPVASLSGGERQRAWIALALAQDPQILLLDEPTTYLDICHQLEVMELIRRLNEDFRLTVAMVLHDINQAARYSDRIIALKNGRIVAQGTPREVLTRGLLRDVFGVDSRIEQDQDGKLMCLPIALAKEG